jgi:dTDP-glucose 4,6-dehydratase
VEKFSFPEEKMAYVIHSMVPDPGMPLPEMEKWFELGTRRLLELAVRERSEGFLLCSTGAVYMPQGRPLTEEDPLIPLDAPLSYGRIRRQVEDQCEATCKQHGIPLKIARGFAMAGPRLPENAGFALADFLRDAREGRPIQIKGSGDVVRSYLYASDMAVWLWRILLPNSKGGLFNVGSPQAVRLGELAEKIAIITGGRVELMGKAEIGASGSNYYVPSTKKAISTLKYSPIHSLEGLLHTLFCPNQEALR